MSPTVFHLLYVNGSAKNVFAVKRYAVRKTIIRPYAVRKLKMKQHAVRKGGRGVTLNKRNIYT